jgi:hypothetical protein
MRLPRTLKHRTTATRPQTTAMHRAVLHDPTPPASATTFSCIPPPSDIQRYTTGTTVSRPTLNATHHSPPPAHGRPIHGTSRQARLLQGGAPQRGLCQRSARIIRTPPRRLGVFYRSARPIGCCRLSMCLEAWGVPLLGGGASGLSYETGCKLVGPHGDSRRCVVFCIGHV